MEYGYGQEVWLATLTSQLTDQLVSWFSRSLGILLISRRFVLLQGRYAADPRSFGPAPVPKMVQDFVVYFYRHIRQVDQLSRDQSLHGGLP